MCMVRDNDVQVRTAYVAGTKEQDYSVITRRCKIEIIGTA